MPKKQPTKKQEKKPVKEAVFNYDPLLMSALLQAKGALIEAQTPQSYAVLKKIMELEVGVDSKTILMASAIQAAKALASQQEAGIAPHPDDVRNLLNRFSVL